MPNTVKTFKIGLSATDRQNMAQDIYELVVNMCFDEYDSSNTYNQGDFVVYENPTNTFKLYKCIANNVTGAWDGTKWELAKLQDILDDIENAVQYVNDKANVDGNYPTMTVGVADQLSPYDEDSGDDQDEPFSFQATGTANGTQSDFSTGSIALMKEKQGNTIVVNQKLDEQMYPEEATYNGITCTHNDDGTVTFNGTSTDRATFNANRNTEMIQGHKYLITAYPYIAVHASGWEFNVSNYYNIVSYSATSGGINFTYDILEAGITLTNATFLPLCIDLTQMFNGNIPADLLSHPENFFRYYQGSLAYNTGTLVNANAQYIKCIGINQWDEEYNAGWMDGDGNLEQIGTGNGLVNKNPIKVIPNTTYYLKIGSGQSILDYYYSFTDSNGNQVSSRIQGSAGNLISVPSNACFMNFLRTGSGTTYNHDISINLYYEKSAGVPEPRCITYEPYEVLTNNDTGTETLRSAGSVRDSKLPSGEIIRRVDEYTILGTESVYGSQFDGVTDYVILTVPTIMGGVLLNLPNNIDKTISVTNSGTPDNHILAITFVAGTYNSLEQAITAITGKKVNIPLATPITEQGTSFSENLLIDDFGSMDFQGTNGVPQGNLIFYPVDYKAFIDTLYNYTEGTPSNIALKTDLASDKSELQGVDTQLLNAIGGTLRQCLCVKETLDFDNTDFVDLGELNWTSIAYGAYVSFSSAKAPSTNNDIAKIICSKYATTSRELIGYSAPFGRGICIDSSGNIVISASELEGLTGTEIQAKLKGIILAYEKA